MNFNQILFGLSKGHAYRKPEWHEGTYIKRDDDDHISLYHDNTVQEKQWSPSHFDVDATQWVPVDAIIAPAPTADEHAPTLLPMLIPAPIGTQAIFKGVAGIDVAYFSNKNQKLVFEYIDDQGTRMPSETTLELLSMEGWTIDPRYGVTDTALANAATALATEIIADAVANSESQTMKTLTKEEIFELCKPLQDRLVANTNYVRIEVPVADIGIKHKNQDVSLLLSITAVSIDALLHVDGELIDGGELTDEVGIEKHMLTGPITQRLSKPLSAIAVPKFMIRQPVFAAPAEIDQLPDDIREGVLSFDPKFTFSGPLDRSVELGTYHVVGKEENLFEVRYCENGVVYGQMYPLTEGVLPSLISVDLFEVLYCRLPKLTVGTRLRNTQAGASVVVHRLNKDGATANVRIDLGYSDIFADLNRDELNDDIWEFVSFDPKYVTGQSNDNKTAAPASA
jgi:hypothetical protein